MLYLGLLVMPQVSASFLTLTAPQQHEERQSGGVCASQGCLTDPPLLVVPRVAAAGVLASRGGMAAIWTRRLRAHCFTLTLSVHSLPGVVNVCVRLRVPDCLDTVVVGRVDHGPAAGWSCCCCRGYSALHFTFLFGCAAPRRRRLNDLRALFVLQVRRPCCE